MDGIEEIGGIDGIDGIDKNDDDGRAWLDPVLERPGTKPEKAFLKRSATLVKEPDDDAPPFSICGVWAPNEALPDEGLIDALNRLFENPNAPPFPNDGKVKGPSWTLVTVSTL